MPMSVTYATVNGRMVQENRGGTVTRYVADTLGSVIKTTNSAGNVTSTARYWPFGEVRSSTGTNPSPWGFVGTLGYFKDTLTRLYVRARTYRPDLSRWMTVDPLWPKQKAYQYADTNPTLKVDPTGLLPFWVIAALIALLGALCVWCMLRILGELADIDLGTQDKRKHCVMACMLRMQCGKMCSGLFVVGTEIYDLIAKLLGMDGHPTWDDVAANLVGFVCGSLSELTTCTPWWFISPRPWCENCCAFFRYGQGSGFATQSFVPLAAQ